MGANREGKGEGSSQRSGGGNRGGGGGGASVSETAVLFPRLHVKETKFGGPRAPPRNKMALYEQFTFPSNRYVPPSLPLPTSGRPVASSTTNHCPPGRSYDGSVYYCPPPSYAGMPWLPYLAMTSGAPPAGQPSFNGSCGSTGMDYEGELRQAPSVPAPESARPSSNACGQGSGWTSSDSNRRSGSSKKARNNDDCTVPTYSAPKGSNVLPAAPAGFSEQFAWQPWQPRQPRSSDGGNAHQPLSVSDDCQVESLRPASTVGDAEYPGRGRGKSDDTERNRRTSRDDDGKDQGEEQSEQQESTVVQIEKDSSHKHKRYAGEYDSHGNNTQHRSHQRHRRKEVLQAADIFDAEGLRSRETGPDEWLTGSDKQGECSARSRKVGVKARRAFECFQMSESLPSNTGEHGKDKEEKRVLNSDGEEMDRPCYLSECKSGSSTGSDDNNDIVSRTDVCERERSEMWSDSERSDASMADSETLERKGKITSRDIISSIGENEFWKARKLLQRQQKIFSAQVFELHRLIKVQQLLAASPNPLIGEGNFSDFEDKPVEDTEPNRNFEMLSTGGDDLDIEPEDNEPPVDDEDTPECDLDKHPDSNCHSATSQREDPKPPVMDPIPGSCNAAPVLTLPTGGPGVPIAPWACPPFPKAGANPWFGAMPAPNGTYMYQPYPVPYNPSPAPNMAGYNGAYGPLMCVPGQMDASTMTPIGMPTYEQRPNFMQDMYRYSMYQQPWQNAVFRPPSSNPSAGWCGVPPMSYVDPASRGPYGWYDEMIPESEQSGLQSVPVPTQQSKAQFIPPSQPRPLPIRSPWTDMSNGQTAACEPDRFSVQVPRCAPAELGHRSYPGGQRPLTYSFHQSCGVTGSQQEAAAAAYGWQCPDGNGAQDGDCDPADIDPETENICADRSEEKLSRRSKCQQSEARVSRETGRNRPFLGGNSPADGRSSPLPLFPLVPALNIAENGKLPRRSSSGVIKAIPRALVATAESAAEILLSIQKQRQP